MCEPGDIIAAVSPTASKRKFHLCVVGINEHGVRKFLFVNSDDGYPCDLTFADGTIENLPKSDTGKTVISFSDIVRFNEKQLELFQAQFISKAPKEVIEAVIKHVDNAPTLNRQQRREIVETMTALLGAGEK